MSFKQDCHPWGTACPFPLRGLNTSPVPLCYILGFQQPALSKAVPQGWMQSCHCHQSYYFTANSSKPCRNTPLSLALPSAGQSCVLRTAVRRWFCYMEPGRVKPHANISFSEQLKVVSTHAAVVGFIILSVQPRLSVCGLTSCWQQWETDCSTAWLQASACSLCGHHSSWQHPLPCQSMLPHMQLCCCCHAVQM